MKKQYTVGIIGAGNIVESSHLPVLINLPDTRVEWIYDTNSERTQLLSSMYSVASASGKWQDALSNVDICLITIPYGVRRPYFDAAAALNKCVYVEKPFATTVQEHLEISSMFKPFGLAVGFQRRYYKTVYQLRELINSNFFGRLLAVDFTQGYFTLKGGKGYLSDAKLSGGGVIIESAIHAFDQILQITGASDVDVTDIKYLQKNGIDYDTQTESSLTTPSGNVKVTTRVSTLRNLPNGLVLSFENATVHCKLGPEETIKVFSHTGKSHPFTMEAIAPVHSNLATTIGSSFYSFWQKFVEAIDEETENLTSASQSLLTTKWMEKIYGKIK